MRGIGYRVSGIGYRVSGIGYRVTTKYERYESHSSLIITPYPIPETPLPNCTASSVVTRNPIPETRNPFTEVHG